MISIIISKSNTGTRQTYSMTTVCQNNSSWETFLHSTGIEPIGMVSRVSCKGHIHVWAAKILYMPTKLLVSLTRHSRNTYTLSLKYDVTICIHLWQH